MEHENCNILSTEHIMELQLTKPSEEDNPAIPKSLQKTCSHLCSFSEEALIASKQRSKSTRKLCGMVILYIIFMGLEVVGGLKANSLAVLTDAAHMLVDVVACSLSLFTIWASSWAATPDKSFGYHRLEVLGAALSVQLIWFICGVLIYEAVERIVHTTEKVDGKLMFIIAGIGFLINGVMAVWLGHDHSHHGCSSKDHSHSHTHDVGEDEESATLVSSPVKKTHSLNINIQGAYLHVLADLIQSVGVMIAGCVIWWKPEWLIVDLLCTLVFSVVALCTTLPMVSSVYRVLMETTPVDIDVVSLKSGIRSIEGVADVHDLHVWAITVGKNVLMCHIVAEPGANANEILVKIKDRCERKYHIHHVTVQIEQAQ